MKLRVHVNVEWDHWLINLTRDQDDDVDKGLHEMMHFMEFFCECLPLNLFHINSVSFIAFCVNLFVKNCIVTSS